MISITLTNGYRLIPARSYLVKPRNIKTIQHKKLYYEFIQQKGFYSLEFFLAQIPYVANVYEIVFVKTDDDQKWVGCFVGTNRKSVIIEDAVFKEQLKRFYYVTNGKIAVINNVVEIDIEEIDFISIENPPALINPRERKNKILNNIYLLSASSVLLFVVNTYNEIVLEEIVQVQQEINSNNEAVYENKKSIIEAKPPAENEQNKLFMQQIERLGGVI